MKSDHTPTPEAVNAAVATHNAMRDAESVNVAVSLNISGDIAVAIGQAAAVSGLSWADVLEAVLDEYWNDHGGDGLANPEQNERLLEHRNRKAVA